MLRRVVWWKLTDVSEVLTASIIRAIRKPSAKKWVKKLVKRDQQSRGADGRVGRPQPGGKYVYQLL
jgi:hypothetical protein